MSQWMHTTQQKKTVVTGTEGLDLTPSETTYDNSDSSVMTPSQGEELLSSNSQLLEDPLSLDNEVFGYDRNLANIKAENMATKRTGLSYQDQRVQVQEETGSQRVQVSNGFQEPFLPSLSSAGRVSSGELLEWSLLFYGTGPEEDDN